MRRANSLRAWPSTWAGAGSRPPSETFRTSPRPSPTGPITTRSRWRPSRSRRSSETSSSEPERTEGEIDFLCLSQFFPKPLHLLNEPTTVLQRNFYRLVISKQRSYFFVNAVSPANWTARIFLPTTLCRSLSRTHVGFSRDCTGLSLFK